MRLIIICFFFTSLMYSNYSIKGLEDTVIIEVNKNEIILKKNQLIELKENDNVCFKEFKVEKRVLLIINEYEIQFNNRSAMCRTINKPNEESFLNDFKHKIFLLTSNTQENVKAGVSRNITENNELEIKNIIINYKNEYKYIVIENNTWSIYPLRLEIINKSHEVKKSFENEDSDINSFIIPIEYIEDEDIIIVKNYLGDMLEYINISYKK
ncbi:hypothetical protein N5T80_02985 [Aliarcobacter cryaerophilus]|uniref:hypothetical protein n=1 Tax=Aliarcobacter cryaerophilus TaxID=28198 RepID=UPI0021B51D33|nr:hypothetical protein [Aliarcobacter cryaerophilus]MCT7545279.1 hypothetical protein [Aliarcobacter cryaerophilus]